jgi:hypothetical protein
MNTRSSYYVKLLVSARAMQVNEQWQKADFLPMHACHTRLNLSFTGSPPFLGLGVLSASDLWLPTHTHHIVCHLY